MKHILDDSHVSHFWSTSWSPIYACYMLFQSLGSQKSNASNSTQFRVEMKELQPLQADHYKLKEEFCTALRNHPFVARWFRSLFVQCCVSPPKFPITMEAEYHKLKDHFAALRNQSFAAKWFRSPFVRLRNLADLVFTCEMVLSASQYLSTDSFRSFLQIFLYKFPFFSL